MYFQIPTWIFVKMQIQKLSQTKIIVHNWKNKLQECTFQQINNLIRKTNHLLKSTCFYSLTSIFISKIENWKRQIKIAGAWISKR